MTDESMSYLEALTEIKRLKEALKQQPCEDAVSRQTILSYICNDLEFGDEENGCNLERKIAQEEIYNFVKKMPPVTPKENSEYEHDHEVVKAYNDGQAYILDRIRAEIERLQKEQSNHYGNETETAKYDAYDDCLDVINKYRGE